MNDDQYKNFKEEIKTHIDTSLDIKLKPLNDFMTRAMPMLVVFENLKGFETVTVWVVGILAGVATIVSLIWELAKAKIFPWFK